MTAKRISNVKVSNLHKIRWRQGMRTTAISLSKQTRHSTLSCNSRMRNLLTVSIRQLNTTRNVAQRINFNCKSKNAQFLCAYVLQAIIFLRLLLGNLCLFSKSCLQSPDLQVQRVTNELAADRFRYLYSWVVLQEPRYSVSSRDFWIDNKKFNSYVGYVKDHMLTLKRSMQAICTLSIVDTQRLHTKLSLILNPTFGESQYGCSLDSPFAPLVFYAICIKRFTHILCYIFYLWPPQAL